MAAEPLIACGAGQTIVMVSHEEGLGKIAQRGIWLRDGVIEKEKAF